MTEDTRHGASGPSGGIEELFPTLVENCPVGIYIVQDAMIIFGNRWMHDFSGYLKEDLPLHCLKVIHPDDRGLVTEQMTKRVKGEPCLPRYPVRFVKKDGTVVEVELLASVIAYNGRPAIQGSVVDISQLMAAERQLQHAFRLRQLYNDIIAHDILNPVSLATGYTDLLLESGLKGEQVLFTRQVMNALNKVKNILHDSSSYLELCDAQELKLERMPVVAMLKEAITEAGPALSGKKMDAELRAEGETFIDGNPMLMNAFANLLSNAAKYGPDGSKLLVEVRAGERVEVLFRDRGPGVPDEYKERIFQRFERVGPKQVKGVGLGLAIVKRLVELHHGAVRVEDNPGGGAVFVLELPPSR